MKTVKFLKDHLDKKAGETAEVTKEQATYFERTKVAKIIVIKKKPADK